MNSKTLVISRLTLVGAVIFIWASQPAYAYLDPGTGTIIIQGIVGAAAAASTILAIYWSKFKTFLMRVMGKTPKEKDKE